MLGIKHLCFLSFLLFVFCEEVDKVGKRKLSVILDVDAGGDDAIAVLVMLSKLSNVDLKAITCVNGNTGVRNVTVNVLKTLKLEDRLEIPVYSGSDQGLVKPIEMDYYFGYDGFGDFDFPDAPDPSNYLKKTHAAQAIASIVRKNPGQITILATGPLTNIALALHLYPDLLRDVKELVFVGGNYQGSGNVRPGIEFNMFADPEAAAFVFSKATPDHPITMFPMETCLKAAFTKKFRTEVLGAIKSKEIDFLNQVEKIELSQVDDLWVYYDPIGSIYLLRPDIVTERASRKVLAETGDGISRGAMFVDYTSKDTSVNMITEVDKEKVRDFMIKALS